MITVPATPYDDEEPTSEILVAAPPSSVAPKADKLTFLVLSGPQPGAMIPAAGNDMVLGRGKGAAIRLDDQGLSREHLRIFRLGQRWLVEDLGSTNGTWVSGRRLEGTRELRDGDRIQVGRTILLKVSLHDTAEQEAVKRIYEQAVRDGLTRTYNRRYASERLVAELAYALRHDTELSVLLLDVDHFKQINDTVGHAGGDAVLRVFGATLQRMVRVEDVVARWGGEEFMVIARGIDARNAAIFGERIRRLVAGLIIPWEGSSLQMTVSVGVATHTKAQRYPDVDALVDAADTALYRAKTSGRNRVASG